MKDYEMNIGNHFNIAYEKNQASKKREKAYSAGESSHEAGGFGFERAREADWGTLSEIFKKA